MANAYHSIATTDFNEVSPGTLTITKPTGLAVNDTMIANIVWDSNDATAPTLPSGWTQLFHDSTATKSAGAYKVADSGDVAASNFVFTLAGTVNASGGSIMRWSGVGLVQAGTMDRENSSTNAPVFTTGITPNTAGTGIIFAYHSPYTHTVSTYAIATDNPSWTEIADEQNVSPDLTMSLAYAIRTEVTATGNFSCATSTTHDDHNGILYYLTAQENYTATPAVIPIAVTIQEPVVSGAGNTSPAVISATVSVQTPTVTPSDPLWSNQDKNTSTWVNQDKS